MAASMQMATPTVYENGSDVAIFGLPDELLMNVFTYITRISKKMELEQVSKRFRSVASQSPSWKGIHQLELMMKCLRDRDTCMDLQGMCEQEFCYLNNHYIDVDKWPAAIKLLIERTQIHQLIVHAGQDRNVFDANPAFFPNIMKIIMENADKMKIEFIEFHYSPIISLYGDNDPSIFDAMKSFLLDSLQMSVPYLKELALNMGNDSFGRERPLNEIWPLVKECTNLQSVAFAGRVLNVDLSVLVGKPLKKVVMVAGEEVFNNIGDFAQLINGASGDGVYHLSLIEGNYKYDSLMSSILLSLMPYHLYMDLRGLCDQLTREAREKLKVVTITLPADHFKDTFVHFPLIPSMLPNLENLYLLIDTEETLLYDDVNFDVTELLINLVSFLTLCHVDSLNRKIIVRLLRVSDFDEFKAQLATECEAADINVQITNNNDDNDSKSVLLSKGKASIELTNIAELIPVDLESEAPDLEEADEFNLEDL